MPLRTSLQLSSEAVPEEEVVLSEVVGEANPKARAGKAVTRTDRQKMLVRCIGNSGALRITV